MNEMKAGFGQRLRALREARGWRQADVSAKLLALGFDKHPTAVHKTEAGKRAIDIDELFAWAQIYEVPVGSFFDGMAEVERRAARVLARPPVEILGLKVIAAVMGELDAAERARVLAYLTDRFGGA